MPASTPVAELPGISPAAVVNLNRLGIVTAGDLLAADYDKLAVQLESFDDASRLVKEARKVAGPEAPVAPHPTPVAEKAAPEKPHTAAEKRADRAAAEASAPRPAGEAPSAPTGLSLALAWASAGLDLSPGAPGEAGRSALLRRLAASMTLLEGGATEQECSAALLIEAAEAGAAEPAQVKARFGGAVVAIVEECLSLRAVPVSPNGRLPKYYLDMAAKTSRPARRACAALQLAQVRRGQTTTGQPASHPGASPWYSRLLLEALEAGGPDDLVARLKSAFAASESRAA